LSATDDRSEMFFRPYLSAVAFVTATSLESVNGVGGNAVRPSFSKFDLARSYASIGSLGSLSAGVLKNDSKAVPVYSG
jgi:hypothetical protein